MALKDEPLLTVTEMDELAERAQGFYGAPSSGQLKAVMKPLNPIWVDDLAKLSILTAAYLRSNEILALLSAPTSDTSTERSNASVDEALGRELDGVYAKVRALLGLPQTVAQDEAQWNFVHPSA